MRDIESKADLVVLIDSFYERVRQDETIGHIFSALIGDDWSAHLPVMYTFWNTVLFGAEGYKGQAVGKHVEIDRRIPLQPAHFERWMTLWTENADMNFAGDYTEQIKSKAQTMMQLIQFKVTAARGGKSLY